MVRITREVDVDIDVHCEACKQELSASWVDNKGKQHLEIEPCETCLESAREEGKND